MSRIQVPLSDSPRQQLELIAGNEKRTVPIQASLMIELGLAAHAQGYALRDGELSKLEVRQLME